MNYLVICPKADMSLEIGSVEMSKYNHVIIPKICLSIGKQRSKRELTPENFVSKLHPLLSSLRFIGMMEGMQT